jgi:hypothetical protein
MEVTMGIKQLQQQYKDGKITKAQYAAALKELLTAGTIEQEDHDTALTSEAEKPIYTQAEVDSFIAKKATQQLKQICKGVGIDIEGVANKDLVAHVTTAVTTLKAGAGKPGDGKGLPGSEELAALQKKAGKVDSLTLAVKDLSIKLAIYENLGGDFLAVNSKQVVRAIMFDYKNLIDIDEDGDQLTVDAKQVTRALQKVKDAEPNLFSETDGEGNQENHRENSFQSKAPGGVTKVVNKKDQDYAALKAKGLAAMGVKTETTQK